MQSDVPTARCELVTGHANKRVQKWTYTCEICPGYVETSKFQIPPTTKSIAAKRMREHVDKHIRGEL